MKKYIFVIILFFFFIRPYFIYAQSPTQSLVPECGFGGISGKDKCCLTLDENVKNATYSGQQYLPGPFKDISIPFDPKILSNFPFLDKLSPKCFIGEAIINGDECICKQTVSPSPIASLKTLCDKFIKGNEHSKCINCINAGGILTGIGCIPINLENLITDYILKTLIGLAGILSLLCIIYSSFLMQTSKGNPEKIKKAQEMLTSCIMGLMLIIFSVFILKLVGVDILRIPGFMSK